MEHIFPVYYTLSIHKYSGNGTENELSHQQKYSRRENEDEIFNETENEVFVSYTNILEAEPKTNYQYTVHTYSGGGTENKFSKVKSEG